MSSARESRPLDDDIHRYEAATTVRSLVLISKAVVVVVVTIGGTASSSHEKVLEL